MAENPETTGRTDLLMTIVREQGEHSKAIAVLEESVKESTVAVQEAAKDIRSVSAAIPSDADCDRRHDEVSNQLIAKLKPIINGKSRKFWPTDFLGWVKVVTIAMAMIGFFVVAGGWLSDRGLMPGQGVGGIEIEASPMSHDLVEELRALRKAIEGSTSAKVDLDGFADVNMTGMPQ